LGKTLGKCKEGKAIGFLRGVGFRRKETGYQEAWLIDMISYASS